MAPQCAEIMAICQPDGMQGRLLDDTCNCHILVYGHSLKVQVRKAWNGGRVQRDGPPGTREAAGWLVLEVVSSSELEAVPASPVGSSAQGVTRGDQQIIADHL